MNPGNCLKRLIASTSTDATDGRGFSWQLPKEDQSTSAASHQQKTCIEPLQRIARWGLPQSLSLLQPALSVTAAADRLTVYTPMLPHSRWQGRAEVRTMSDTSLQVSDDADLRSSTACLCSFAAESQARALQVDLKLQVCKCAYLQLLVYLQRPPWVCQPPISSLQRLATSACMLTVEPCMVASHSRHLLQGAFSWFARQQGPKSPGTSWE